MAFHIRSYQFIASHLRRPAWQFAALLSVICIIITLGGDSARAALRYEHALLGTGLDADLGGAQYYRALTGNLTHLGWPHLWLNLFGLLGVWAIYASSFSARIWALLTLLCGLGISAGLYYLSPHVPHMVGLSGTLHGLLAAALIHNLLGWIARCKEGRKDANEPLPIEDVVMLLGLWAKIAYEHWIGAIPLTEATSGGPVITATHLYGAVIGTITGASIKFITVKLYRIS